MRQLLAFTLALCCLGLAGCGDDAPSTDPATNAGLKAALDRYEKAFLDGDEQLFCSRTSEKYLNKLAAGYEEFGASCERLFVAMSKQERESTAAERGVYSGFKVRDDSGSAILRNRYDDRTVRTKLLLTRQNGRWVLDGDEALDPLGPVAPAASYRKYLTAIKESDAELACELVTDRGKGLLAASGRRLGAGATCEAAVDKLALSAALVPDPEVIGGQERTRDASVRVLQSDSHGGYLLREIYMKKTGERWLFDHLREIGHSGRAPAGPSSGDLVAT